MLGMSDVTPACGPATSLTPPKCVLTFTPWMAPQIGPVSTVYKTIMTTEYNVRSDFQNRSSFAKSTRSSTVVTVL